MRYETINLERGMMVSLWDNEKKDFVREGDTWTRPLITLVKNLKQKGFQVTILN